MSESDMDGITNVLGTADLAGVFKLRMLKNNFSIVLNHSTFEFQDFSERAPGSNSYVQSTYF